MNPLSNVRFIKELNEKEVRLGISENASWHNEYKDSAWVFVGGLAYELTEGDVICVFSQFGEIVNINLIRDKGTGKSKGYCFLCYEDQRSTVLAVDNFNGIRLSNRTIRVDHVANYKIPKDFADTDDFTKKLRDEGCAPGVVIKPTDELGRKHLRNIRNKRDEDSEDEVVVVKKEKHDPGYDKYESKNRASIRQRRRSRSSSDSSDENFNRRRPERRESRPTQERNERRSKSASRSVSPKSSTYEHKRRKSRSPGGAPRRKRSRSKSPYHNRYNDSYKTHKWRRSRSGSPSKRQPSYKSSRRK